jgi:predicted DNA-binding protein (MmcQ/YjbR family)
MDLKPRTAALKAVLDAQPGADALARRAPGGRSPLVLDYRVMGKTFAILGVRDEAFVVLKCDPHLIEILKEQYAGVGHRSHLDRRHWIAVNLDADVPEGEVAKLAEASYRRVRAGLTRKQQAELDGQL